MSLRECICVCEKEEEKWVNSVKKDLLFIEVQLSVINEILLIVEISFFLLKRHSWNAVGIMTFEIVFLDGKL